MPRNVDPEGFDAARDTVGAGIYSGKVKRDASGNIIIGQQYQNHNPVPGPIYAGGGYTEMSKAIHKGPEAVAEYLQAQPDIKAAANEVSTGGATPRGPNFYVFSQHHGGEFKLENLYGFENIFTRFLHAKPKICNACAFAEKSPRRFYTFF